MHRIQLLAKGKFKFCFLEIFRFFLPEYFQSAVNSMDIETAAMERGDYIFNTH